jgi:nicotinamidase-related amidase
MAQALVVVDVQNDVVGELPPQRRSEFLGAIASIVERARSQGTPLIYIRHQDEYLAEGSPGWQIVPEVAPHDGDSIVEKRHADAFEETNLDEVLRARGIDRLTICGMQSDFCVDGTTRGALRHDYRVTLVADAHATYPSGARTEADICESINRELDEAGVEVVPAAQVTFTGA